MIKQIEAILQNEKALLCSSKQRSLNNRQILTVKWCLLSKDQAPEHEEQRKDNKNTD